MALLHLPMSSCSLRGESVSTQVTVKGRIRPHPGCTQDAHCSPLKRARGGNSSLSPLCVRLLVISLMKLAPEQTLFLAWSTVHTSSAKHTLHTAAEAGTAAFAPKSSADRQQQQRLSNTTASLSLLSLSFSLSSSSFSSSSLLPCLS